MATLCAARRRAAQARVAGHLLGEMSHGRKHGAAAVEQHHVPQHPGPTGDILLPLTLVSGTLVGHFDAVTQTTPIDKLKIDISFIREITTNSSASHPAPAPRLDVYRRRRPAAAAWFQDRLGADRASATVSSGELVPPGTRHATGQAEKAHLQRFLRGGGAGDDD